MIAESYQQAISKKGRLKSVIENLTLFKERVGGKVHLKVGSPLPFKQESCEYFSYVLLASNAWGESCFAADCEHYLHNEEVTLLMLVSQIVVCICIARAIKQVKESIHMVACCIVAGGGSVAPFVL